MISPSASRRSRDRFSAPPLQSVIIPLDAAILTSREILDPTNRRRAPKLCRAVILNLSRFDFNRTGPEFPRHTAARAPVHRRDMALRRAARATAGLTATAAATALAFQGFTNASDVQLPKDPRSESSTPLPSRETTVRASGARTTLDVLVIGGGATGAGCAVDAATRGLSVALVEGEDFGRRRR